MRGVDNHIFRGMFQGTHEYDQKPEYLWEARNVRFEEKGENTQLTITNEKSPLFCSEHLGVYKGSCVFSDRIVIFLHKANGDKDGIYQVFKDDLSTWETLFEGNLNFSQVDKIQTLGIVETEDIQKVYWVDGINQPRVIRLSPKNSAGTISNAEILNFVRALPGEGEQINIERQDTGGLFAPGVIQYFFTYYSKYGQETNIVAASPLQYIKTSGRGLNPEETCNCSFKITLKRADTSNQSIFDYVRVYSIQRTSIDAVPIARRVIDLRYSDTQNEEICSFVDNGTMGETIDSTQLLYLGGEPIIADTLVAKDRVLFLGNIKINTEETVINVSKDTTADEKYKRITLPTPQVKQGSTYSYDSLLDISPFFKNNETYRFGVQFQDIYGKWTTPQFIEDRTIHNELSYYPANGVVYVKIPKLNIVITNIPTEKYIKVRPVVVFPKFYERRVLTQGILCPTVYQKNLFKGTSANNIIYYSSWFARPTVPGYTSEYADLPQETDKPGGVKSSFLYGQAPSNMGGMVEFRNDKPLANNAYRGGEIEGLSQSSEYMPYVNTSIVTMHSPEIELDESSFAHLPQNTKLKIIGKSYVDSVAGYIDLTTSTPTISSSAKGLLNKQFIRTIWDNGDRRLSSCHLFHTPFAVFKKREDEDTPYIGSSIADADLENGNKNVSKIEGIFKIYPWQKSGSLGNDVARDDNSTTSAILQSKHLSNILYSSGQEYLKLENNNNIYYSISEPQFIRSGINNVYKIYDGDKSFLYSGYVEMGIIADEDFKRVHYKITDKNDVATVFPNSTTQFPGNEYSTTYAQAILGKFDKDWFYAAKSTFTYNNPITIKYNSGNHLVFKFKNNKLLPRIIMGSDPNPTQQYALFGIKDEQTSQIDKYALYQIIDRNEEIQYEAVQNVDGNAKIFMAYGQELDTRAVDVNNTLWDNVVLYTNFNYADISVLHNTFEKYTWGDIKGLFRESTSVPQIQRYSFIGNNEGEQPEDEGVDDNTIVDKYVKGDYRRSYFVLAELMQDYQENNIDGKMFDGNTSDAKLNNIWIPAGEAVNIPASNAKNISMSLDCTQGDTWFQRYDCLKTYPMNLTDENCVTEIVSFMCETRINLDGRYDRNRGQIDNTAMTPDNFNLVNPVYSQKDNFFSYKKLDEDFLKRGKFPASITWTLPKKAADFIDEWTHITMASTLDLPGIFGEIKTLVNNNDALMAFQEKCISQILYNEQIQIPTEGGAPIEITNSARVQGYRVLAQNNGILKKQHLKTTKQGIFFRDSITKELTQYAPNAEIPLRRIHEAAGFSKYFWDLQDFDLFWDDVRNDLYTSNLKEVLIYSGNLGVFTSFIDYNNVEEIFNFDSNSYYLRNDRSTLNISTSPKKVQLYKMFDGEGYCLFPGSKEQGKPATYSISFIANPTTSGQYAVPQDKIFDTMQIYADFWGGTEEERTLNEDGFATIRVQNEYQDSGVQSLINTSYIGPTKQRFRLWNIVLPRDKNNRLQRIRNPWAKITLSKQCNGEKMIFHNVSVGYTY